MQDGWRWIRPIPEIDVFRSTVRAWLEANLPDGWFEPGFELQGPERDRFNEEWTPKLFEGGWICASWPKEHGGKGLSVLEAVAVNEEFARAEAPMRADFFGDTLVGPTLLQWGTEAQKREFLPGILQGRFERGTSATTGHRRFEKELDDIIDVARAKGAVDDPIVRQRLVRQWSKIQIMRINGLRTLTSVLGGGGDPGVRALGAAHKMFWSEAHRDTMELAMDVLGMDGQLLTGDGTGARGGEHRGRDDYPVSPTQASFFCSRSETIWGGTAEIQRNIVGERVLGLPKEPKPA